MWLTNEGGNRSNLEAAVVAKEAMRLTREKHGPRIFRDLGEWILDLMGIGWALPEGWGQPVWIGFPLNHFGVCLGLTTSVGQDILSEKPWYNEASGP